MDKLLAYLNGLPPEEQKAFAARCGTTVGYLRKACSVGQALGDTLCVRLSCESGGAFAPEDLLPGVDWQYLREALANTAQTAAGAVAVQGA
jgi:DNA-binding transcriptional regulator YdaS (Cro superfamily)